jgi:hypothetical protein
LILLLVDEKYSLIIIEPSNNYPMLKASILSQIQGPLHYMISLQLWNIIDEHDWFDSLTFKSTEFIKEAAKYPSACWGDQSGLARRAIQALAKVMR